MTRRRRYTLPPGSGGLMIVPPDVARHLSMLLEPGRRSMAAAVSVRPELRAWLAELDAFVPSSELVPSLHPPDTVWIATSEAAKLLGVTPRQARNLATKLRTQRVGGRLLFDRDDVLDEVDARSISPTSPNGNPRADGVA